jgi:hypothetical protein
VRNMAGDGVRRAERPERRRRRIAERSQLVRAASREDAAAIGRCSDTASRWFRRHLIIFGGSEQHAGIGVVGWHQHLGGGTNLADPAAIHVKAGSLDQSVDASEAIHIWTSRALPGIVIPASAMKFPQEPL